MKALILREQRKSISFFNVPIVQNKSSHLSHIKNSRRLTFKPIKKVKLVESMESYNNLNKAHHIEKSEYHNKSHRHMWIKDSRETHKRIKARCSLSIKESSHSKSYIEAISKIPLILKQRNHSFFTSIRQPTTKSKTISHSKTLSHRKHLRSKVKLIKQNKNQEVMKRILSIKPTKQILIQGISIKESSRYCREENDHRIMNSKLLLDRFRFCVERLLTHSNNIYSHR